MRLRNFFLGAVASIAAFAACQEPEQNLGTPDIKISKTEIAFGEAGGQDEMTVTATRDWMAETDADWVVVSPESGVASDQPYNVTVTALENTGLDREASIKFTIGMKSKYLTVTQAGPGGPAEALIVYYNNYDKEVAEKTYGSGSSWPYLDQFDGWKNAVGTGAANVEYAYNGMSARANSTSDSNYSDYEGSGNNNMFFGKSAYLATKNIALGSSTGFTLTFGSEKYSQDNGSVFLNSEFHIFLSNDGQKWVELKDYTFAGGATEGRWNIATADFSVPSGTQTLSICMQVDPASSYRMDDLKLVVSEGGAVVDFSKGTEKDFSAGSGNGSGNTGAPESKGKKTVQEFISAADTQNYYELTGTVSGFNSQYCSFDLTDATGKIYVYSVLDASKSQWASKIANGGTVTIYGKYLYYEQKSQHEVVDAYIVSYTSDSGNDDPVTPPSGDATATIADVLASSGALASGTTIEAVVISNRALNNLTSKKGLYVQDATGGLQFYLAANHEFDFGDKVLIDLSGASIAEYNGAVQISGLAVENIALISKNNTVTPKSVTINDFLANKYEGQYVAIEGVQVVEADLNKTFVEGDAHTSINVQTADGKTFAIFSSKYATFGTKKVPQGSGTIKGISSISKGAMQLIFAQDSDYAGLTGTRFDGTTPPDSGDQGGDDDDDPVTPPSGDGQFESNVSWTLGNKAYDNTTAGTNAQTGNINGVDVSNLLKLGTSSLTGDAVLHIPAGTKKIGFYCIAWKNKKASVKFSTGGSEITTITPAANVGATGNPPYTITVTDSDYFEVTMPTSNATDVKVETLDKDNGRVIFIGIKAIK